MEVGSCKLEAGRWKLEVGRKVERNRGNTGHVSGRTDRQNTVYFLHNTQQFPYINTSHIPISEAGSCELEAGSWKLEAGSWKLEVGRWKVEINRGGNGHVSRRTNRQNTVYLLHNTQKFPSINTSHIPISHARYPGKPGWADSVSTWKLEAGC